MSKLTIEVRMDDVDSIMHARELLDCFMNGSRVRKAQARYHDDEMKTEAFIEERLEPVAVDCLKAKGPQPEAEDVELDSAGEPWDAAKHSQKKTKLKDGTWRPRRGVKTDSDKPVPPPPPAGEAGMSDEEISYKDMMDTLRGKGLDLPAMNELAKQVGLPSIALLVTKQELIPAVLALIEDK